MREKLKKALNFIIGMNIAHALVLALLAKSLFSTTPLSVVALTVPVLLFEAYKLFLKSKQPDPVRVNDEVRKELETIKAKMNALSMEKNVTTQNKRFF